MYVRMYVCICMYVCMYVSKLSFDIIFSKYMSFLCSHYKLQ